MNNYTISTFENLFKPHPKRHNLSWSMLHAAMVRERPNKPKKQQMLWSPTIFDGTRRISSALQTCCIVFDIDNGLPFDTVAEKLQQWKMQHIMHTTASSTPKKNKYRVILPIPDEPARADDWTFYHAAAVDWFSYEFGKDNIDTACSDVSRAYFVGGYGDHKKTSYVEQGHTIKWGLRAKAFRAAKEREWKEKQRKIKERIATRKAHTKHLDKKHHSHQDTKAYIIDMLYICSNTRAALANKIGARLNSSSKNPAHNGTRYIGFNCPFCNRNDLTFFYAQPTMSAGAYCGHVNSCGDGSRPRYMSIEFLAEHNNFL
jgi:hypothetical protein